MASEFVRIDTCAPKLSFHVCSNEYDINFKESSRKKTESKLKGISSENVADSVGVAQR